jgi:hypothetical protein
MRIEGDFALMSPGGLLQILCQERRSVTIEAWNGNQHARIAIAEGEIAEAQCDQQPADESVYIFLGWDVGIFAVQPWEPPSEPGFIGGWEELALEAARRRDEESAGINPLA